MSNERYSPKFNDVAVGEIVDVGYLVGEASEIVEVPERSHYS